jgi:uncharacterized protein YqgC (DUF456 family)
MRLYVNCRGGPHRLYFTWQARSRADLPNPINITCNVDGTTADYHPWEVFAEAQGGGTAGGAILGGLLGILAGPVGVVLGGIAGGAVGGSAERQDAENARKFNGS